MDKRNRPALGFLLAGVAAVGRALLAVPECAKTPELTLTLLAALGAALLAVRDVRPMLANAVQLALLLVLCGTAAEGGGTLWLLLRCAELWLWLFSARRMLLLAEAGRTARLMPAAAAVPLAVYTAARLVSAPDPAASPAFVIFSALMLWYAAAMIAAYNRTKK